MEAIQSDPFGILIMFLLIILFLIILHGFTQFHLWKLNLQITQINAFYSSDGTNFKLTLTPSACCFSSSPMTKSRNS